MCGTLTFASMWMLDSWIGAAGKKCWTARTSASERYPPGNAISLDTDVVGFFFAVDRLLLGGPGEEDRTSVTGLEGWRSAG